MTEDAAGLIVALWVAGVLLILAEVFLPGAVAGILGGICWLIAIVLAFETYGPWVGMWVMLGSFVLGGSILIAGLRFLPEMPFARELILRRRVGGDRPTQDGGALIPNDPLLGQEGIALTPLRPGGKAMIDGRRLDVESDCGLIEAGERVRVTGSDGLRITVRRAISESEAG